MAEIYANGKGRVLTELREEDLIVCSFQAGGSAGHPFLF